MHRRKSFIDAPLMGKNVFFLVKEKSCIISRIPFTCFNIRTFLYFMCNQSLCFLASDFSISDSFVTSSSLLYISLHKLLFKSTFSILVPRVDREIHGQALQSPACKGKVCILWEATCYPRDIVSAVPLILKHRKMAWFEDSLKKWTLSP